MALALRNSRSKSMSSLSSAMEMATRAFVFVLHLRSGLPAPLSSVRAGGRFGGGAVEDGSARHFLVPLSRFFRTLKCFSNCNVSERKC